MSKVFRTDGWEFQKWFEGIYKVYESSVDKSKKGWHRLKEVKEKIDSI